MAESPDPKLKETMAYLNALKTQLEKSGADERQVKVFMDTTKDGLAKVIESGKYPEYPKVEQRQDTRQSQQPKTQTQQEVAVKTKTKSKEMEL